MIRLAIVGCGYVGRRVAESQQSASCEITVVARSAAGREFESFASHIVEMHWCDEASTAQIPTPIDVLLVAVSHQITNSNASMSAENRHARGLENLLSRIPSLPRRLIYLSTTGVYASRADGAWIDEESPCEPDRPGTKNAREAELWLLSRPPKWRSTECVILRPAGIYGPERMPNLRLLKERAPIHSDPDSYNNLIHVDDLVAVIDALIHAEMGTSATPTPAVSGTHTIADPVTIPATSGTQIFNVADGNPPLRREYYEFLAKLAGVPTPVFSDQTRPEEPGIRARGAGSKRIRSSKIWTALQTNPKYGDFQQGLASILAVPAAAHRDNDGDDIGISRKTTIND